MTQNKLAGKMLVPLMAIATFSCSGGAEQSGPPPQGTAVNTDGVMIVQYSETKSDTFPSPLADSILVLDWLGNAAGAANVVIVTQKFAYGTLVEQIGHHRNGDGGYWLYKVNGAMVPRAASAYRVARSDTVLFFFDER